MRALCSTRLSRPQNGQLYFCGARINLSPGKYFYRAADSAKLFSSRLNRRSFHFASPFATRLPEASEREEGREGGRKGARRAAFQGSVARNWDLLTSGSKNHRGRNITAKERKKKDFFSVKFENACSVLFFFFISISLQTFISFMNFKQLVRFLFLDELVCFAQHHRPPTGSPL